MTSALEKSFERFCPEVVERSVRRLKLIFASLLPLLWLAASLQQGIDQPTLHAGTDNSAPTCSASSDQSIPHDNDSSSSDEFARPWRGHVKHVGPQLCLVLNILRDQILASDSTRTVSPDSEQALFLSRQWQFSFRTALAPRAPSFVS